MLILWVSLFLSGNTVSSVTVVREGLFGSVSVNVARGFLAGTFPAGFTAGQVLISGSPLSFTGSMKNATFSAVVSFPCIIQLTMTRRHAAGMLVSFLPHPMVSIFNRSRLVQCLFRIRS